MAEKQTNLKFSEDLKGALREKAQMEGISLTDLVNRICQRYLSQEPNNSTPIPTPNQSFPRVNQCSTTPALADELAQLSRLVTLNLEIISISSRLSLLENQIFMLKGQILESASALEQRLSVLEAQNNTLAPHSSCHLDSSIHKVNTSHASTVGPAQIRCQIQQLLKLLQSLELIQYLGADKPLDKDDVPPSETKNQDLADQGSGSEDQTTPTKSTNDSSSSSFEVEMNSSSKSHTHQLNQEHIDQVEVVSSSDQSPNATIAATTPTIDTKQWLTPTKAYESAKQRGYPSGKNAFCMIANRENAKEKFAQYGLGFDSSKRGSAGIQVAWFYLLEAPDFNTGY